MALVRVYSAKERAAFEAKFMECRARRRHNLKRRTYPPHNWRMPNSRLWQGAKYLLHKECEDCGTWRHEAISHAFTMLVPPVYDWPDGYLREPGEGPLPADELKRWEVEQVYGKQPAPKKRLRAVS